VSHVVDTNILVRLVLPHDPLSPITLAAVDELQKRGEALLVTPQNMMEFWAVATRPPTANGLGFTNDKVLEEVRRMERLFRVIDQPAATFRRWRQLVETHAVRGRQAFDAHLAAVMMESGLERILTFNVDDFRRYPGITAVSPQSVAAPPASAP
jgi:predicted nucleic acid-binding protein